MTRNCPNPRHAPLCLALLLLVGSSACAHTGSGAGSTTPAGEIASLDRDQLLQVAAAAEQLGDSLRAQQYLLAARRAGADDAKVLPRLFRLYVADGQYRLAIDLAKDQLRSHPQHYELRLLLAGMYEATELEASAIVEYERVLVSAPSEPRAHFALASLLHEHGRDPASADQHYRAYLALAPNGPNADEARSLLMKELP